MNKITLLLCCLFGCAFAQDSGDLSVSFMGGGVTNPNLKNANSATVYGIELSHYFNSKHALSFGYWMGEHFYFDEDLPNNPNNFLINGDKNATIIYNTTSLLYKYVAYNQSFLSITPSVGVSAITLTHSFFLDTNQGALPSEMTYTTLAFPLAVDVKFIEYKNFWLSIGGMVLIEPDYPVRAYMINSKLSYLFRKK
jgi:hypothetical protein